MLDDDNSVGNRPSGPVFLHKDISSHLSRLNKEPLKMIQNATGLPVMPDFTSYSKDDVVAAYTDLYNQSLELNLSYLNVLGMIRDKDMAGLMNARQDALESVILALADLIKTYTPGLQSDGLIQAVTLINSIMPGAINR